MRHAVQISWGAPKLRTKRRGCGSRMVDNLARTIECVNGCIGAKLGGMGAKGRAFVKTVPLYTHWIPCEINKAGDSAYT